MSCRICLIPFGKGNSVNELFGQQNVKTLRAQLPCGCKSVMCLPCLVARSLIHKVDPQQTHYVRELEGRCYVCWRKCNMGDVQF